MDTNIEYIPLGTVCSPATGLRNLSLRKYALPFDWIRSSPDMICNTILNDFNEFHKSLKLSDNQCYITDTYGFEFPHDYPTITQANQPIQESEEANGIVENTIVKDWESYVPTVQEKYKRRIYRFNYIMNSSDPVIVLHAGEISAVKMFKETFLNKYGKTNISYVVLSEEIVAEEEQNRLLYQEQISLCEPEEILIDENDNMFIDTMAQAKLWHNAICKLT
jgi:hypothetical protein